MTKRQIKKELARIKKELARATGIKAIILNEQLETLEYILLSKK